MNLGWHFGSVYVVKSVEIFIRALGISKFAEVAFNLWLGGAVSGMSVHARFAYDSSIIRKYLSLQVLMIPYSYSKAESY